MTGLAAGGGRVIATDALGEARRIGLTGQHAQAEALRAVAGALLDVADAIRELTADDDAPHAEPGGSR